MFLLVLFKRVPIGIGAALTRHSPGSRSTYRRHSLSWREQLVWVRVGVTAMMIEAMMASIAMMMMRRQRWV